MLPVAGCSPPKARDFELGLIGPVGPGVAAAARAAGLTVRESATQDADLVRAAAAIEGSSWRTEERLADWSVLRFLVARGAVRGRTGVFFVLPAAPAGKELTDFPEEWQALERVSRETAALRPILEYGIDESLPFPLPAGIEARALRYQGRGYLLLVNDTTSAIALPSDRLKSLRALFEVRADARDILSSCPGGRCLPAGNALWLEGRL
ncbi:MAG: hypothetical protein COV48_11280 [Elusimicrobia bacterium CG11_big_fil_rev_8_21_14_0_20_64_6]|nr:MAG: hypothetical protein COV48_11280 [Elusimicrobia bacterium CG11_big_fil_rev_8_21_14_0_20_64_6]